ncbi:hypothetical protein LTR08_001136 [Meristemomyces frigidus]|nr:hypothetical protein LTR08_001136 [Meristemomyces frigidus]
MTTTQLSTQLTQLSDSLKSTNTLITRLAKLAFQPGSEPLDAENSVRIELAQDIHDALKQLEQELELLQQEADDLATLSTAYKRRDSERDRERARVGAQVARLGEDLRHARSHFRRAQLTAKRASEAAKQKERELVFASIQSVPETNNDSSEPTNSDQRELLFANKRSKPGQQHKQLSNEELEANASTSVTAALRRTHNLLSTELSRSRFAQETFDESTAALAELGEHYTNLDSILAASRNLLGTLVRSQKSDTWYLETAFYILCVTLGWLFFRRILFGPFVKLPLFLWRVSIFLANWVIWRPLFFLLTLSGVVTTTPPRSTTTGRRSAAADIFSSSRPPLIIQPSAKKGGIPQFAMADRDGMGKGGGVPAGAGGAGAKVAKDEALAGKMSEQIAQMHDRSSKQAAEGVQGEQAREAPPTKRGDGTVLRERREDEPRNPRKKAFEADVEDAKQEKRVRDDL